MEGNSPVFKVIAGGLGVIRPAVGFLLLSRPERRDRGGVISPQLRLVPWPESLSIGAIF